MIMRTHVKESEPLFLCGDLGTSSLKAALISGGGNLLRAERIFYRGEAPYCWEDAFFTAVELLLSSRDDLKDRKPDALVLSGNGPTLVPVTGDGPLAPLLWSYPDSIPGAQNRLSPVPGEISSFFLPKIAAFSKLENEAYKKTVMFLTPYEWLNWRCGAPPFSILPRREYERYYWDEAQLSLLGIDPKLFPQKIMMGSIAGTVTRRGPLHGVPIVCAGPDFIMALIGTGTLEEGKCCDRCGSSEGINVCAKMPLSGGIIGGIGGGGFRVLPHILEGYVNIGIVIPKSGTLLSDYAASIGIPIEDLPQKIFLQKLDGGLKILEQLSGAVRAALDKLEAAGYPAASMTLSGGQALFPQWNQFKADRFNRVLLECEIVDAELAGDALVGALALEGKNCTALDLRQKAAKMIRIRTRYLPRGLEEQ
ncbi:MAG: sugar kinase [Treponema sp.]|jgi:sugar (pentulose or hexulose) kinase|nr:sugar kinase [Treponema sp.]